jgi:hypothetical protein
MIEKAKKRKDSKIGMLCNKCYTISTLKEEILRPYKVHKIVIHIENFKSDGRLMQVMNHLCERPWRVLTQYVYISKTNPYISLDLVCPIHRRLAPNEDICHISFIQPEEALHDLKGKKMSCTVSIFYESIDLFTLIYFSIFYLEMDDYFHSESEEENDFEPILTP